MTGSLPAPGDKERDTACLRTSCFTPMPSHQGGGTISCAFTLALRTIAATNSEISTDLSGLHAVHKPGHPAHVHITRHTMHAQRLVACTSSNNRLATCVSPLIRLTPFQFHRLLIMSQRTVCLTLSSPSPSDGKRASRAFLAKGAPPPQPHRYQNTSTRKRDCNA